ncbi:MAG TPA: hypothetical protein VHD91_08405 [Gaiellaceae bacterium]|nr:hypothetical protein [Gaiellaceae bacterium]
MAETEYVILRQPDPADDYVLVAEGILGHSAEHVLRQHASKPEVDVAGTFVAIPTRSWRPQTIAVETTRTVKIGGA